MRIMGALFFLRTFLSFAVKDKRKTAMLYKKKGCVSLRGCTFCRENPKLFALKGFKAAKVLWAELLVMGKSLM